MSTRFPSAPIMLVLGSDNIIVMNLSWFDIIMASASRLHKGNQR